MSEPITQPHSHEHAAATAHPRRIAIVGAGQAGLQMTLSLLGQGHAVTLITERSAEDIESGYVMSSQCLFGTALKLEHEVAASQWDDRCPPITGISFAMSDGASPSSKMTSWRGELASAAMSVDQRLKLASWLDLAEEKGAEIRCEVADIATLESLAASHDLVLVATGRQAELNRLFERDAERSIFDRPQRALAMTYVHGLRAEESAEGVSFNLIPGIGELFVMPAITHSGPCHIVVLEGVPAGPMDCWQDVVSAQQHLQRTLEVLRKFAPWELAGCKTLALTDSKGILKGAVTPAVCKPVGMLPSGRVVLGMGDAVLRNDPITGQGANTAVKCSQIYFDEIVRHGTQPFTAEWMSATFERFWQNAGRDVTQWTHSLLSAPPPHIPLVLGAAAHSASLAGLIANGFDDPSTLFPWWIDPVACEDVLRQHGA
ncbi:hypothetical protein GCM10027093_12870 [Paraburkholderia jirisanensis]